VLQLVGDEKSPGSIAKPRKTWRRRKADARYAFAAKAAKGGTARRGAAAPPGERETAPPDAEAVDEGAAETRDESQMEE